jgi:hypothetical protein
MEVNHRFSKSQSAIKPIIELIWNPDIGMKEENDNCKCRYVGFEVFSQKVDIS